MATTLPQCIFIMVIILFGLNQHLSLEDYIILKLRKKLVEVDLLQFLHQMKHWLHYLLILV